MEQKTIVNILFFAIVLVIVVYFQLKEKRKNDKYFGNDIKLTKKENKIIQKYKDEYELITKDKRLPTLKKDKFILDDVSKLATEMIFDFPIPTKKEKESLIKGDLVKLIFLDKDNFGERMWVEFIEIDDGLLKGLLKNDALDNDDLIYDKVIWFHPNHILEIESKN